MDIASSKECKGGKIIFISKGGRSLVDLVFWCGLDDDICFLMPKGDTGWSLEDYINFALWVDGSSVTVVRKT